ncbi:serine O-acetyltransferase EpsC [Pararobbsia silviterrae]|uniref:serine O-acetyltransferase n=1 Tax=Pararobbsia silviterrae TaxID=1792498 RepID=A0A494XZU4_9BURK|nr:serine O-acetyltransferase EpsC [Pararobbsia silviterrae]RKP54569.1 serine acetyltransferase [Pararobbsia silviterrae]
MQTQREPDSSALFDNLHSVVARLRESREVTHKVRHRGHIRELPSRQGMRHIVEMLSAVLFPTHYGRPDLQDANIDFYVGDTLSAALSALADQIRRALLFAADERDAADPTLADNAHALTARFADALPEIRAVLVSDLYAAYQGDPAATSISEVLLCYPGCVAVIHHRLAHALYQLGVPLLPRLIADIAHSLTGIDIHPAATIGNRFFIDHGTGVVIGETAIIGRGVRLYQAVTLGAKRFPVEPDGALTKGVPRHPIVEDDVVIYAGATVLGRITIGKGSTIGGNVWLTHDVPPGSNVSQAQMTSN